MRDTTAGLTSLGESAGGRRLPGASDAMPHVRAYALLMPDVTAGLISLGESAGGGRWGGEITRSLRSYTWPWQVWRCHRAGVLGVIWPPCSSTRRTATWRRSCSQTMHNSRLPAISHHHWLKWLSMGLMPSNMMPFCDRLHTSPHMQQCFKRLCAILEAAVHNQFTARTFVISVMMAFASF